MSKLLTLYFYDEDDKSTQKNLEKDVPVPEKSIKKCTFLENKCLILFF